MGHSGGAGRLDGVGWSMVCVVRPMAFVAGWSMLICRSPPKEWMALSLSSEVSAMNWRPLPSLLVIVHQRMSVVSGGGEVRVEGGVSSWQRRTPIRVALGIDVELEIGVALGIMAALDIGVAFGIGPYSVIES